MKVPVSRTVASLRRIFAATLAAAGVVVATAPARAADPAEPKPRHTLFVGVDTSGSFRHAGYEDAMTFLAHYLYGHVNELGGLAPLGTSSSRRSAAKRAASPRRFVPSTNSPEGISRRSKRI